MRAQLRGADPRAQVVGRVEARIHVGEVRVGAIPDTGRLGQQLFVDAGIAAVGREARPEVELVPELRLVPAEEERLQERRRLGVLPRFLGRQAEVALMPLRLARDRLDDVAVDLRERVVARDAPEGVRQRRIAAPVMQRVTDLVQERLVVVQASLGARDQMHDGRRVARDHAGPRRLLRPVVEIEPDVRLRGQVEAQRLERLQADLRRALLRVGRLERRQPAHVRGVEARRHLGVLAEQPVEPARLQRVVADA